MAKDKKISEKSSFINFVKKPFLCGGVVYIVLFFLGMISSSLNFLFPSVAPYLLASVSIVCYILVFNALFALGRVYDSKLLRVLSIMAVVFSIIFSVFILVAPVVFEDQILVMNKTAFNYNQTVSTGNYTELELSEIDSQFIGEILDVSMPFLVVLVVLGIFFLVYIILFGVSLIKLGDRVEYAKTAGILNIVGICTLLLIVGIFVLIAASVLETLMLFNQAKKFKELK